jgi:hypothetical protein
MAINAQRYAKRMEELLAQGKSQADAHEQASRESESTTTKTPAKKKRMSIITYLMGAKSSVPKAKADILKKADKDIQEQQNLRTQRSKDITAATGVKSDPDRAAEEIAKKARRTLLGMRK